ncbi:LysE family translocator [Neorhizobium sp. NPDC001467]|uniref:LysE family translocator n=1 Tax=Neorhizobium sp. NPDC001467 TaxID=3390595 RepID=UPI003D012927
MSSDTMLVFAASLFLVILPGPLADLTARYTLARGRATGLLTVPAIALGLVAAMTAASLPVVALARTLPHLFELVSWIGMVYLMLHVLWTLQHPARGYLAHNDNLPERRPLRIVLYVFRVAALRPRSILAFLALLPQALDPRAVLPWQLVEFDLAFIAAVVLGSILNMELAGHRLRRMEKRGSGRPASRKPHTRFISRRAVTAGYRRIAA